MPRVWRDHESQQPSVGAPEWPGPLPAIPSFLRSHPQVYSKNFIRNHQSPDPPVEGAAHADKGIRLLLAFRENEKSKGLSRDALQTSDFSRKSKGTKRKEESQSQDTASPPSPSATLFCCPQTKQTFHSEIDARQVFII
jgi:hypothetical protein